MFFSLNRVEIYSSIIREDDDMVYFIYQSAKGYLTVHPTPSYPRSSNLEMQRYTRIIVPRSVQVVSTTLQRDNYELLHPACSIEEVESADPDHFASIGYAGVYWIDHIYKIESGHHSVDLCNNGTVDFFLKDFLY